MANAIPTRSGQINGAGDATAIFLKMFAGEILTVWERAAYFRDKHLMRTIPSGKSAQFPATGIVSAFYHTPGEEILGDRLNAAEKLITIEGMLIAAGFTANIDELMTQYDYRSILANEIGNALAKQFDQNVGRVLVNAARITAALVNGVYASDTLASTSNQAAYGTDGPTLFSGIYDAGVVLDNRDIPMDGRYVSVDPTRYALLIKSEKPFDFRLNDGETGLGGYAKGMVRMIAGMPVGKTNNMPITDDRAATNQPASRQKDYSVTRGLIHHKSAAGTVALQDVTTESAYDIRRQGTLLVGKYVCGHGELRGESAYELRTADPTP